MDDDLIALIGQLFWELDVRIDSANNPPTLGEIRDRIGAYGWVSAERYAALLRKELTTRRQEEFDPSIGRAVLGETRES